MRIKNRYGLVSILVVAFLIFTSSNCTGGNDPENGTENGNNGSQNGGGTLLKSYTNGNENLPGSPYGYETWDFSGGNNSQNKFYWYGPDERGGGAFRAEWKSYFLARLGFFWGNGGKYTQYKNIYIDYEYRKGGSSSGGFIGMYGWSRNSSAVKAEEKLIEFYIVDDWLNNTSQLGINEIKAGGKTPNSAKEFHSFTADGATYKIYTNLRTQEPSIDGTKTFIQLFSVRQGRRTKGTISVTEHFKEWSKVMELGNLYEVKFKVESFGGNGWIELDNLRLSMEDEPR